MPAAASDPSSSHRSVHRSLGGGAVADVLLWRRRHAAAVAAAGATSAWLMFERGGYSPLSLAANALLLLVAILFFWARSASLLNRPLPPLPNLEVSDELVGKVASKVQKWINWVLGIAHDIAIRRDRMLFLKVILVLWAVAYVGSSFNFLTLVYIAIMMSLVFPPLYEKYQVQIDEKVVLVHNLISMHFGNIQSMISKQPAKEKKTE